MLEELPTVRAIQPSDYATKPLLKQTIPWRDVMPETYAYIYSCLLGFNSRIAKSRISSTIIETVQKVWIFTSKI